MLDVVHDFWRFQDGMIIGVAETLLAEKVLELIVVCIGDDVPEIILLGPNLQLCEKLGADTLKRLE